MKLKIILLATFVSLAFPCPPNTDCTHIRHIGKTNERRRRCRNEEQFELELGSSFCSSCEPLCSVKGQRSGMLQRTFCELCELCSEYRADGIFTTEDYWNEDVRTSTETTEKLLKKYHFSTKNQMMDDDVEPSMETVDNPQLVWWNLQQNLFDD